MLQEVPAQEAEATDSPRSYGDLVWALDAVQAKSRHSEATISTLVELFRQRCFLERQYADGLRQLAAMGLSNGHSGTLKTALDVATSDLVNISTQHGELASSITIDVLQPLLGRQKHIDSQRKTLMSNGKQAKKELSGAETSYLRSRDTYSKVSRQKASQQRSSSAPSPAREPKQTPEEARAACEAAYSAFGQQVEVYRAVGTRICRNLQAADEDSIRVVQEALMKYCVFEVAAVKNRQYDTNQLARVMDLVDVQEQVQLFLESTPSPGPPSVPPLPPRPEGESSSSDPTGAAAAAGGAAGAGGEVVIAEAREFITVREAVDAIFAPESLLPGQVGRARATCRSTAAGGHQFLQALDAHAGEGTALDDAKFEMLGDWLVDIAGTSQSYADPSLLEGVMRVSTTLCRGTPAMRGAAAAGGGDEALGAARTTALQTRILDKLSEMDAAPEVRSREATLTHRNSDADNRMEMLSELSQSLPGV